tara:strand:- start:120 stop:329 length:210 start_codon:yes stop_codon:yes gene_type:complete
MSTIPVGFCLNFPLSYTLIIHKQKKDTNTPPTSSDIPALSISCTWGHRKKHVKKEDWKPTLFLIHANLL